MAVQRFNVFGSLFDIERHGGPWSVLSVGDDGKRAGGLRHPRVVKDEELGQFLFDLFHEQAAFEKGGILRVDCANEP